MSQTSMHRRTVLAGLALFLILAPALPAQDLPQQVSDREFWRMISEFSEPGGTFRSDNFVSNETSFQYVIPDLKKTTQPGGVYLGVGPDQNFTYIVALKPKIAFIVDIRRQNMLEHLMYKALIELSANRSEFVSRLFSRKLATPLKADATADELFQAYRAVPNDPVWFAENVRAVKEQLLQRHEFKLTITDQRRIGYVYNAFFLAGPELTYSFTLPTGRGEGPTFWQLMTAMDLEGQNHSYLATEANFQALKQLQERNLVIPLVGDFAGPKALRTLAEYLKERTATVTAFYVSNVEQYLFQGTDNWARFFRNVATLPLDSGSMFIRATFNNTALRLSPRFARTVTQVVSIEEMLKAFEAGLIQTYTDIIMFEPLPSDLKLVPGQLR